MSSQKLATILDGKHVASVYKQSLKEKINARLSQGLRPPGLAVILVGNDTASSIYVSHKQKACLEYQVHSDAYHLSEDTSEKSLLS